MSSKELDAAAMKLTPKGRVKLAERLLASLDDEARRAADASWALEAESRIDEYDSGVARSKFLSLRSCT